MLQSVRTGFPIIVRRTLQDLVPDTDEVRAILKVAFLSAEADLIEDPDEIEALQDINDTLWRLTGLVPEDLPIVSPLPLPIDDEARTALIRDLAAELSSMPGRELAYVLAYLLTVVDLDVAPVERVFLDELRRALEIDLDRANELVTRAAELVTPGLTSANGLPAAP